MLWAWGMITLPVQDHLLPLLPSGFSRFIAFPALHVGQRVPIAQCVSPLLRVDFAWKWRLMIYTDIEGIQKSSHLL